MPEEVRRDRDKVKRFYLVVVFQISEFPRDKTDFLVKVFKPSVRITSQGKGYFLRIEKSPPVSQQTFLFLFLQAE